MQKKVGRQEAKIQQLATKRQRLLKEAETRVGLAYKKELWRRASDLQAQIQALKQRVKKKYHRQAQRNLFDDQSLGAVGD